MGDKTESKLELRVETNRLLIPASSSDARLKDIPGYGWQPSVQAWEFDDHPGIAAIAMEVLGENLNIPESQRTKVNRWKARLSKRTGPELKPQAIGNMCLLEHAPADTKWARLIPTYRPHGKASRFLKHPRVEALIEQVFGLAKSQVHAAATEKIKAPRDRKVRRRPVRAAGERAQEPAKEQPSAEPSVVDELAEILDHPETVEPARIAALIYELDARDSERAAVAAAIALRRLPGAADFKALLDFLLGQNQLGSDSIDGYAEFLNGAAAQKAGWLHQITGEGVARLQEHSLQSVLQLGMKLAQDTTSRTPESQWKSLFRALGWDDRARLLLELFINFEWSHDVLGRLARLALTFVDEEPLPDVGPLIDLLDLCDDDVSWYSRALRLWQEERLVLDGDTDAGKLEPFLRKALAVFAGRTGQEDFEAAFDSYTDFLLTRGNYDELEQVSATHLSRLRIKAALLLAEAKCEKEGNAAAAEMLLARFDKIKRGEPGRGLLLEEAEVYASEDDELLARTRKLKPKVRSAPPQGKVLVVGGNEAFRTRLKAALAKHNYPQLEVNCLLADEAKDSRRVDNLVSSYRRVLLYSRQISHAASGNVKNAVKRCKAKMSSPALPGVASVINSACDLVTP